ncbi:MAG TPA: PQQ-binding-like beta-propeller repeat protein [Candidatus Limnocylindrales bacterium]
MTDVPADDVRRAQLAFPGGLRVRLRWAGSGQGPAVFALSEVGGRLEEHGGLVSPEFERLCRAEIRVEGPGGAWTARLASPIFDEPRPVFRDLAGLLAVGYGFVTYAFDARTGELRWSHRSRTPLVGVLSSSRLDHLIVQSQLETFALEDGGEVRWRVVHSDAAATAELVGGRLVLSSYEGLLQVLDPSTGRAAG